MEKGRKANWTREEECSLINEIESAGEILRGSGNSADKNKRRKNLERHCSQTHNSVHSNGRAVEDIRKKWTNLKLNAKSKVDASFREARKTGRGTNTVGQVEDEDMQILSADRSIFADSADRVTEMFQNILAFSGISGAAVLFQSPAENNEIPIASTVSAACLVEFEGTPILESPEMKSRRHTRHQRKFGREGELLSKMIRSNS